MSLFVQIAKRRQMCKLISQKDLKTDDRAKAGFPKTFDRVRNSYTNVSHSKQQVSNATSQTLYEHYELSVFLWSGVAECSGRRPARLSVHVLMCYS